jgi:hypothetical protein
MPAVEFYMRQESRYRVQDTGFRIQDTRYQPVPLLRKRAEMAVRILDCPAAWPETSVEIAAVPEPPLITITSRNTPLAAGRVRVLVEPLLMNRTRVEMVMVPAAAAVISPVVARPKTAFSDSLRTLEDPSAVRS